MLRAIVQFLVTAFALWLAAEVVPGVTLEPGWSLVAAALLLGIINAIVRPILVVLTFPITAVTFGLFLLVVNAATIGLTAMALGGFTVEGFWPGIGAAMVTGVVSWIAGTFIQDPKRQG